ncbi:MAG TPA: DHH family phosphoesterase [Acidimicrobiia bacterium]|nr:DHH family phosphoesterase [Acidimicrobiia bacterium]
MTVDAGSLADAARILRKAPLIVLTCHLGPDGDALGSMLGVALAAKQAGKVVLPTFGPPFELGPSYRFLPTELLVPPAEVPETPEVLVTFDSGNLERLGDLAPNAVAAGNLIVLDHHAAGSGGFGHINLIDPTAAATAEIAFDLVEEVGWKIDARVATCFLTGLVTDTGRFQYSNTSPATLRLAARLVELGARPEEIGQHVYEETAFGYLPAAAAVLARAQLVPEAGLVWSVLYQSDLEAAGIGLADTDSLIDLVRLPIEASAAMMLKEHAPGIFKGSLRSRGQVDVGSVAVSLGGGGHHNAAGFTFEGTPEDAVNAVVRLLKGRP